VRHVPEGVFSDPAPRKIYLVARPETRYATIHKQLLAPISLLHKIARVTEWDNDFKTFSTKSSTPLRLLAISTPAGAPWP